MLLLNSINSIPNFLPHYLQPLAPSIYTPLGHIQFRTYITQQHHRYYLAMSSSLRSSLVLLLKLTHCHVPVRVPVQIAIPRSSPLPHSISFAHCETRIVRLSPLKAQKHRFFFKKNEEGEIDKREQDKKANLGSVVEELRALVPRMVHENLPKDLILSDIMLRICPSHFDQMNAFLPNIKGHVSYYAACKALQLIMTSVVVNPNVQLHIQSIRTTTVSDFPCIYPDAQKIIVRWTTCPEGCTHLRKHSANDGSSVHKTSDAKLGSHRWSRIDADKFVDPEKHPYNWSLSSSLADLTKGIIGLRKEEEDLERVILGIFIFELNDTNDQIIAHTIEDMDVIERREQQGVDGKLRVC